MTEQPTERVTGMMVASGHECSQLHVDVGKRLDTAEIEHCLERYDDADVGPLAAEGRVR